MVFKRTHDYILEIEASLPERSGMTSWKLLFNFTSRLFHELNIIHTSQ